MKACEDMAVIMSLYIDNELNDEELEHFENHLKQCPACKEEMKQLKEMLFQVRNLEEIELPKGFHEEVMKKIQDTNKIKPKGKFRRYGLVASMFLMLASIGIFLSNDNSVEDFGMHAEQVESMISPQRSFMLEEDAALGRSVVTPNAGSFDLQHDGDNAVTFFESRTVSSYKILLEVADVEESFHIISNLPGDTQVLEIGEAFDIIGILSDDIWQSIDADYDSWIFFQKEINVDNYEFIRNAIEALGIVVAE